MAATITDRNDTHFLLLGSNAIESVWPFAPDYQNAFLINKTHLSSCLVGCLLTAPKKKRRLVFGGQWDPKIKKDENTQYLLFQESLLKNDYRSDVHVAGKWVITSLKTSIETCWF